MPAQIKDNFAGLHAGDLRERVWWWLAQPEHVDCIMHNRCSKSPISLTQASGGCLHQPSSTRPRCSDLQVLFFVVTGKNDMCWILICIASPASSMHCKFFPLFWHLSHDQSISSHTNTAFIFCQDGQGVFIKTLEQTVLFVCVKVQQFKNTTAKNR